MNIFLFTQGVLPKNNSKPISIPPRSGWAGPMMTIFLLSTDDADDTDKSINDE
ncbi:MAG: hypothetical protein WKF88_06665 [Ferruginibacter sp.]